MGITDQNQAQELMDEEKNPDLGSGPRASSTSAVFELKPESTRGKRVDSYAEQLRRRRAEFKEAGWPESDLAEIDSYIAEVRDSARVSLTDTSLAKILRRTVPRIGNR